MTVHADARPIIGRALLFGAALMLALAAAFAFELLPTGGELGPWVPVALMIVAAIDILLALFFLTRK